MRWLARSTGRVARARALTLASAPPPSTALRTAHHGAPALAARAHAPAHHGARSPARLTAPPPHPPPPLSPLSHRPLTAPASLADFNGVGARLCLCPADLPPRVPAAPLRIARPFAPNVRVPDPLHARRVGCPALRAFTVHNGQVPLRGRHRQGGRGARGARVPQGGVHAAAHSARGRHGRSGCAAAWRALADDSGRASGSAGEAGRVCVPVGAHCSLPVPADRAAQCLAQPRAHRAREAR